MLETSHHERSQRAGCSISIVIPSYNYGHYLNDAVKSVLNQSGDWDLTVIDDGSTDNTGEVARVLAEEFPGQFNYIPQENRGLAGTRNRAVALAQGDYLLYLDADDWLCEGAIEKINDFIARSGRPAMVICDYYSVDSGRAKLRSNQSLPATLEARVEGYLLKKSFNIASGATIIRRDVLEAMTFPEHLSSTEDLPFYAGVLATYKDVEMLHQPVANIRKHADRMRLDVNRMEQAAPYLNEEILSRLPATYQSWQRRLESRHFLSMSRLNYMAGNKAMARRYYWSAVKIDPRSLFKLSYLKKMLKSIF